MKSEITLKFSFPQIKINIKNLPFKKPLVKMGLEKVLILSNVLRKKDTPYACEELKTMLLI